jgi:uncharacterized repeat protein (TIGR02543 family)
MANQICIYSKGQMLLTNTFKKTGYQFIGWSMQKNATTATYTDKGYVINLTDIPDGIVTLYAVWQPITYQIKFNANGGSGSMANQTHTYGSSKALTPNAFTRADYVFIGWSMSQQSDDKEYSNGQTVTNLSATNDGIVNFYAIWAPDASEWTYTLDDSTNTITLT